MNGRASGRRGEPLFVLAVLLTAWVGTRAMTWESPLQTIETMVEHVSQPFPARNATLDVAVPMRLAAGPKVMPAPADSQPSPVRQAAPLAPLPAWLPPTTAEAPGPPSGEVMASHQLLWLAAMGQLPVPPDVAALMRARAASRAESAQPSRGAQKPNRWSFDSWLLLRSGETGAAAPGGRLASYGASQAGAVVRYRLEPDSAHRPAAYVRATQALAAGKETELAAGIAARPIAAVPVSLYAEARVTRHGGGETELRPAAFAVTELPPVHLPLGFRGEVYAQAGYVGGRFATAFADGQARADREVARFDLAKVRAGAGIWGGAQKGAARLDVGPTASLALDIGGAPARLALDYRWRIAGEAAPDRGIAVTLSTGF